PAGRRPAPGTPAAAASGGAELDHLLSFGGIPPEEDAGGQLRGSAQRARTRVLKPYADHQHRINAATGRALDDLRAELAELRSALAAALEMDVDAHGRLAGAEERLRLLDAREARQDADGEGVDDPER